MSNEKNLQKSTPLKWVIKRKDDGRYVHLCRDTDHTVLFYLNKALASVFESTRDYVDGLCLGLQYALGDTFEPELISAHIQMPTNAEVDDNNAGV
jgi:hypothetical protein